MTNKEILQADMLDILFEHRNKLYGAYALRKTYSGRLRLSLGIALSIVLVFIMMSFINKNKGSGSTTRSFNDSMILIDVNLEPEEPEPEKPKPIEKPPQAEVDYQPPTIVEDNQVKDDLPTTDEISKADVGNEDREGEEPADIAKPVETSTGNGDNTQKPVEEAPKPVGPTKAPSFPGGTEAWLSFLRKYLNSPEDLEPGQRIEVQVRFLIDVDGSVSNSVIVKSGGNAFDKEVMRALKKMPKWEPALQNGNPIATPYTQPVIFIGVEQ